MGRLVAAGYSVPPPKGSGPTGQPGWLAGRARFVLAIPPQAGNLREHRCDHRSSGGAMAGKFEVYKDRAGKFRFRLKANPENL